MHDCVFPYLDGTWIPGVFKNKFDKVKKITHSCIYALMHG